MNLQNQSEMHTLTTPTWTQQQKAHKESARRSKRRNADPTRTPQCLPPTLTAPWPQQDLCITKRNGGKGGTAEDRGRKLMREQNESAANLTRLVPPTQHNNDSMTHKPTSLDTVSDYRRQELRVGESLRRGEKEISLDFPPTKLIHPPAPWPPLAAEYFLIFIF